MLKIWGRTTSINVQKVLWCCAELSLKYDRVDAGGKFGVNNTPEYLAMNPNGLVPTIQDDGLTLWESHAIVRYLSRKHGRGMLWPNDDKVCANADRWMEWYSTTLWQNLRPVFWNLVRVEADKRDMKAVEDARRKMADNLKMVELNLADGPYMAGGAFTMGDIPMGVALHRWFLLPLERPDYPRLAAYYERLKQRPAFAQHCAAPLS
ncbi:MAG: glutathione S-transferase family protein [Burkholderiales bacterium]